MKTYFLFSFVYYFFKIFFVLIMILVFTFDDVSISIYDLGAVYRNAFNALLIFLNYSDQEKKKVKE